jgi:CheY-like chemotaxis protein
MSYPLTLQSLVIEDDEGTKDAYKVIFDTLAGDFSYLPFIPAQPRFAFSYEEAVECLNSSKMFHLVILDLRLPERSKLPPRDGVDLGPKLLSEYLDRDTFPIPSLLVISGHIGATDQTRMQERLRAGFHYGRHCVKGDYGLLENEIRQAYKEAVRYCGVGIHIRDGGRWVVSHT